MKIVILDKDTVSTGDVDLSVFEKFGDVSYYGFTEPKLVADRIGDADVVFCNKAIISDDVFNKCTSLKYIGLFATGYNNIDLESATKHNVTVCNAPDYSTNSVAQHTFALILEHFNRVGDYASSVKNGEWIKSKLFSYFYMPVYELDSMTIGIIGYGSIGKRVAQIAKAFGMKVLVYTRTIRETNKDITYVSLEELLKCSDIVTLHCPLTDKTKGLINKDTIALMKKSAILINTSRGPVVDENALYYALENDLIAGAGLDVISVEPMLENNPLRKAKNCYITPHIAWAPKQTRERLIKIVTDNYTSWLTGDIKNKVN